MGFDKIVNYIKIARQIEKQLDCKIYIIGGFVRDKIVRNKHACSFWSASTVLMPESVDLDFVVEGDGLKVAEVFHKKLGGKLTIYKKFLTASLKLKNNFVIDIATARTEKYPCHAAMPAVKPAKLEQDLLRRDFTINTLAIPIRFAHPPPIKIGGYKSGATFSTTIIDVCGGLSDIKNKLIRVLHKNSFIDDPIRILRAIRYAVRFNFKIEKNTEKWINAAIKKNLLSLVSKPRIRDEFLKTLEEKHSKKILTEFKKRKILKYIDNRLDILAISENRESVKTRLKKLLKNFTEEKKVSFLKELCLPVKKFLTEF